MTTFTNETLGETRKGDNPTSVVYSDRPGRFTIVATSECITIMWDGGGLSRGGTASASFVPACKVIDDHWYVNRVLVQDPGARNSGIGGRMLELLKQEIVTRGGKLVVVEPGGYDSDPADLARFYLAHGFKKHRKGWREWRP